jgi:hypothetical protein
MFKLLPPPQVLKGDTGKMFISLFWIFHTLFS